MIWCDDQGVVIKKKALKKMKHAGKAYLKTVGINKLPTPFELTGDKRWDVGGEFYQMYDLELNSAEDVLSVESGENDDLNTYDDSEMVENSEDEDDDEEGVKVINYNAEDEVIDINKIIEIPSLLDVEF